MKNKICSYFEPGFSYTLTEPSMRLFYNNDKWNYKKTILTCPECKRRIVGWAIVDESGWIVKYVIRKRKRKKWWKKNALEKKNKKESNSRRNKNRN